MSEIACPRCGGSTSDPDEVYSSDHNICCGAGECGSDACTGPETIRDAIPAPCILCHGGGETSLIEAFYYGLTGEVS